MGELNQVSRIIVTPLERITVKQGDVLRFMKCSDPGFVSFGEAYFSIINYQAVKGWKRHLRMTLNLVVPFGLVRFAFIDERGSKRFEISGSERYVRITVPPGIWFAFKGQGAPYSILMNIADITHDPNEIERIAIDNKNLDWS